MFKYLMKSMDGVPEEIQKLYTKQEDGTYILTGIDGAVSKAKVDEFRTNNITLSNQLEAFKDVDPSKYKELMTEVAELKIRLEKSGYDEEAVQKIVESRVSTMQKEFSDKESNMAETIKTQNRQLESLIIDGQVKTAALEHGISESAIQDVVLRAKSTFKMEDGKAVGYDGSKKLYNDTGVELQNINGWVKGLEKSAPHLFKASQSANLNQGGPGAVGDPSKMTAVEKIRSALPKS